MIMSDRCPRISHTSRVLCKICYMSFFNVRKKTYNKLFDKNCECLDCREDSSREISGAMPISKPQISIQLDLTPASKH